MKKQMMWFALLMLSSAVVHAQDSISGQRVWEEFSERIGASQKVSPLGPDLFGEGVSLSNGALSFSATDLAIPGSDALPVALERQYTVFNRRWRTSSDGMLADWDLNLPSMSAVFAPDWEVQLTHLNPVTDARCSVQGRPPVDYPFEHSDFWHGVTLNIPGREAGEILRATSPINPQDGKTYPWVTGDGKTRLTCLQNIKNGKNGTGEGFLAITPDGTKYWFDWMAQTYEPGMSQSVYVPGPHPPIYGLVLKKNTLYATRIEDRFGNYVELTYTNAWNAPGKLTSISASDGRTITLSYSGAYVSSVSDGTRTWGYSYATTPSGRTTLNQVIQPDDTPGDSADNRRWLINFYAFTNDGEIKYYDFVPGGEIIRTCTLNEFPQNLSDTFIGTLTHPSGAVGTFTVDIREHGRSHVPISCRNVTSTVGQPLGASNNQNDDVNLWATSAYSFTLKQKRISGPGLATAEWDYSYEPNFSIHRYEGTTAQYPVCDWEKVNCSLPFCKSESCARASKTTVTGPDGQWTRHSYGNTYRYNEGKLLKVEKGASNSPAMQVQTYTYDLSQTDKAYPAQYGSGLGVNGDSFKATFHRPLLSSSTTLTPGATFTYTVNAFDAFARPIEVTRSSTVSP